jgi:HSP20 family protein
MADRKKRRGLFDFFGDFDIFDIEEEMKKFMEEFSIDELKRGEPLVYGFNIRVGPDGKPSIQQFGNVKPTIKGPRKTDSREPLVDVIEREKDITVIVELPGVDKSKIKLNTTERMLTISAPGEEADFFKELKLPAAVDPKSAKASYKNGVLEVCLEKREKSQPKAENIKIE